MTKKILYAVIALQAVVIIVLALKLAHAPKAPEVVEVEPKAKVAFVFDDWGYNTNNVGLLRQIKRPVTISVLPKLRFSEDIARDAHKRGIEVMVHLPLEPKNKNLRVEETTIYTHMQEDEVVKLLQESLESVPHAKGMSGHRGSAATRDKKIMKTIFSWMKPSGLYFLDSLVTGGSVCEGAADQVGLEFAKRDVFLDNEDDAEYISGQIRQLARIAKLRGEAIGIGHDRRITLETVKNMIPELEEQGIELVYVSELTR